MRHREILEVKTSGRGLFDVTARVAEVVRRAGPGDGLCHVFVKHTSASLVVQENADPAVLRDLQRFLDHAAPERPAFGPWEHDDEGPDDMPAHVRSMLTHTSEILPVEGGRLLLGTWQALYLFEHRARPHVRTLVVTLL